MLAFKTILQVTMGLQYYTSKSVNIISSSPYACKHKSVTQNTNSRREIDLSSNTEQSNKLGVNEVLE